MASLARPDAKRPYHRPLQIGPLVRAIAREIRERSRVLAWLEGACAGAPGGLRATEAACERRELARATSELAQLGCTIVAWAPLTVAIERQRRKELWMLDDVG